MLKKLFTMKKNFSKSLIIFFLIFLLSGRHAAAQSASQSATVVEVDKLKEKIASKVAEIEPGKKIVFRGKVAKIDAKNKSFTIASKDKTYEITFSLQTKFFWIKADNEKLSLNFNNIEIDDELVILGDEVVGENKIIAKTLYGKNFLKNIVGKISAIDVKTHLVTVKTLASETTYAIDVTSIADKLLMVQNHKEQEAAFDQLSKNDLILAKGVLKDPQKNLLTAKSFYLIQN